MQDVGLVHARNFDHKFAKLATTVIQVSFGLANLFPRTLPRGLQMYIITICLLLIVEMCSVVETQVTRCINLLVTSIHDYGKFYSLMLNTGNAFTKSFLDCS
jgi:hypothetical protein